MAYRIDYGPPLPRRLKEHFPLRLVMLTCGFFAAFLLGVKALWPEGSDLLARFLLPVHNSGSFDAVEVFLSGLRSGEPFYDSLTAFCRQVIAHADIPLS